MMLLGTILLYFFLFVCGCVLGYAFYASYRAGHVDGRTNGYDAWSFTRTMYPFKFFYDRGYREGAEERAFERSFADLRKNMLGY